MAVPDGRRWYKITVPGGVPFGIAGGSLNNAYAARLPQVAALGAHSVAVFATTNPRDTGDFYFSPAAALLLADFVIPSGGVPCDRPSRDGLSLLHGPSDALDAMLTD